MTMTITLTEREIKVFSLMMSDYFNKKPPTLSVGIPLTGSRTTLTSQPGCTVEEYRDGGRY